MGVALTRGLRFVIGVCAGSALLLLAACNVGPTGTLNCSGGSGGVGCGGSVGIGIKFDAPTPNEIDATEMSMVFTPQNVVINDGTYSATINVYDGNNNLVASQSFDYYVSGEEASFSDPSAVSSWLNAQVQSGDTVNLEYSGVSATVTNPNAQTGTVTAASYYDGQQMTSATSSFSIGQGGGGCKYDCQQKGPTTPPRSGS